MSHHTARRRRLPSTGGLVKRIRSQLRMLEDVAATIGVCIDEVAKAQLHETAALLSIARLDLMTRIYRITEQELDQLERAVIGGRRTTPHVLPERRRRHLQDRRRTMRGT